MLVLGNHLAPAFTTGKGIRAKARHFDIYCSGCRTANLTVLRLLPIARVATRMATNRTSSRLAAQTLKRSASPQEDLSAAIPLPVLPVVKSEAIVEAIEPPKKRRRTTKAKAKAETDEELEDKPTKKARKTKADAEDATAAPDDEGKPAKKPRKKKTDLPESFPVRDKGESKKYIGSHCSAAGGTFSICEYSYVD